MVFEEGHIAPAVSGSCGGGRGGLKASAKGDNGGALWWRSRKRSHGSHTQLGLRSRHMVELALSHSSRLHHDELC